MTVSATYSPPQYVGNGTTTSFGFPFQFFAFADLVVNLFDTTANANVSPQPVLNGAGTYDYVVTGTQDVNTGEYLSGGNVVFNNAPLGNHRVTITRNVAPVQPVVLSSGAAFPPKTIEGELDRLTLLLQQIAVTASISLQLPPADAPGTPVVLPPLSLRLNGYLGFDGAGNLAIFAAPTGSSPISTAMAPVVNSSTVAAAFNLLVAGGPATGPLAMSGAAINEAQGANIASAATINLDTATGNLVDVTGTTTITAITLSQGRRRLVRFTGILTLTNGASLVLPGGTNIITAAGDFAEFEGYAAGIVRCSRYVPAIALPGKQPTYQTFSSGSGTYTTPAGAVRLRVRMVGAGGGAIGSGSGSTGTTNGGNTTFGTSLLTANGGQASAGPAGPTGGTATVSAPAIQLAAYTGTSGVAAMQTSVANVISVGGPGGSGPWGGGGTPGSGANTGGNATAPGSGGGGSGVTAGNGTAGAAAGGNLEAIINNPAASYPYAVGVAGTGGTAGASGGAGGNGFAGYIVVEEYYS